MACLATGTTRIRGVRRLLPVAVLLAVISGAVVRPFAAASPAPPLATCDPHAVFARMRAVTGGRAWNHIREISAAGSAWISGLRGSARLNDDLTMGRFAQRFRIAVQGGSAEVYDGTTLWARDISGGVHPLDSPFPRARAVTDAYLTRRGYFNSSENATLRCLGFRKDRFATYVRIRVVPRNGIPADLAIDARSFLLASVTEVLPLTTLITHFSDYRNVAGLALPFAISSGSKLEPENGYTVTVKRYDLRSHVIAADFARPAAINGAMMDQGRTSTTVPMTLEAQQLIVWASLNGHASLPFVLDTGGHAILTTLAARTLGLRGHGAGATSGSGPHAVSTQYTSVRSVRIGDAELHNQPFLVIPYGYSFYERGRKTPLAGLIGLEFFERYATRIDYAHRALTFTPLERFRYHGDGTAVRFHFQEDMPMVYAAADGHRGLFGTDTGNSGSLILFGHYLRESGLLKRYPAGFAIQGHGTGGTNGGRMQTLQRFTLGGHDLHAVPTVFTQMQAGSFASWTEAGNIGFDVLSRFAPTYDYAHETLYLEPSPNAPPLLKNRAGLSFVKNGPDAFDITIVRPKTPAARAGMKAGDQITRVNGAAAAAFSRADLATLASQPGKLRVRVARGGVTRDVTLVLP